MHCSIILDRPALAAQGERYFDAGELAAMLGKKPSGGHWIQVLQCNATTG
jgi:hypothetical protein